MFAVWGLSGDLIQLSLQARGYGLLALLAFWSCVLVDRYAGEKRLRDFALLGVCTALGAYTIPSYVLFGGPLMAFVSLRERNLKAWGVTAATAGGILLLYAPVARELIHATVTYRETYGVYYVGLHAVAATLRMYLWRMPEWAALTAFAVAMSLPFTPLLRSGGRIRAIQSPYLAVLFFLAACLVLQTPPIRTTSFVALPVAYGVAGMAGQLFRGIRRPAGALVLCVLLLVGGCGCALSLTSRFYFVPYENWLEAWRFVSTMYPPGSAIDYSRQANGITYYADQDRYCLKSEPCISGERFGAGEFPVLESPWKERQRTFDGKAFSSAAAEVVLPGKMRDITISFCLPGNSHLRILQGGDFQEMAALCDRQAATGAVIRGKVTVLLDGPCHSLNLLCENAPKDLRIVAAETGGQQEREIGENRIVRIGDVVTLPLEGANTRGVVLRLESEEGPVRVSEIWANPLR